MRLKILMAQTPQLSSQDPQLYTPNRASYPGMNPSPVQLAFLWREMEVFELFKSRGVAPHHLTVRRNKHEFDRPRGGAFVRV